MGSEQSDIAAEIENAADEAAGLVLGLLKMIPTAEPGLRLVVAQAKDALTAAANYVAAFGIKESRS